MLGDQYQFGGLASSAPSGPDPEELAKFALNDDGNAMRLIRWVGGKFDDDGEPDLTHARLLYLRNRGWIAFDKKLGCWSLERGESRARRLAIDVGRGLHEQMEIRVDAYEAWCLEQQPKVNPNAKRLDAFREFARSGGNKGRIESMLSTAASFLEVELDVFDRDPLLLNVANGTLKFRLDKGGAAPAASFVFREGHDPADRCTRVASVKFDPAALRPIFDDFLGFILPAEDVREAVHRIFGYSATGLTKEQAFFVLQGKGGDGKSTLVNVIRQVLGTYADNCGVETFLDTGLKRGGDASPDIARLAGDTRLISTGEPPRNAKLNTGSIKAYTGGSPVLARELRQGIFSFIPIGKVLLECNNRPKVPDSDDGIWRRLLIVPFTVQIEKSGRPVDQDLPEKLKAEGPGILNWIIAGVVAWLEGGLARPEAVKAALEDYRRGAEPFAQWLADRVIFDPAAITLAGEFYTDYKNWMEANGHDRPMSQKSFGGALGDLQIMLAGKDSTGKTRRRGAKLRALDDYSGGVDAGGQQGSETQLPPDFDAGDAFGNGG